VQEVDERAAARPDRPGGDPEQRQPGRRRDHAGVGEQGRDAREERRRHPVVAVEHQHQRRPRRRDPGVPRRAHPRVVLAEHPDAVGAQPVEHGQRRGVRRPVVDHHELGAGRGLRADRGDGRGDLLALVVGGDDDGDLHAGHASAAGGGDPGRRALATRRTAGCVARARSQLRNSAPPGLCFLLDLCLL